MSQADVDLAEVLSAIQADAEAAREELPAGFEASLDASFQQIAADLVSLAKGVEAGELTAPSQFMLGRGEPDHAAAPSRRAHAARSVAQRGLSKARRVAGPKIRAVERASMERAGRVVEQLDTQAHVTTSRLFRLSTESRLGHRMARVSPRERVLPGSTAEGARQSTLAGGSWEMEDWAFARLKQAPEGQVLHAECGDGDFVRRLAANGYAAKGADPSAPAGPGSVQRAGALEALKKTAKGSLSGLVLSGFTDNLSSGQARALVDLSTSRLQGGGLVIVVSLHPDRAESSDVVTSDLAPGKALHPVTWCHLLARYGFSEVTVHDPEIVSDYFAVTARRP